ncbi:MAG: hypothetical protein V1914_01245 [archaeon]
MINSTERALKLRETLKKDDKILVVDFSETLQGKDTSRVIDLMPNVATGEYIFRTKVNIKELDPLASKEYGTEFFDIRGKSNQEIEDFVKKQEFDFPLWYKHDKDFLHSKVPDYNYPFILQVAGCNFHDGTPEGGCKYCFVDDKSNDGAVSNGKTSLGIEETVESMLSAQTKINKAYTQHGFDTNIKVLRVSGGEPTIVLDWVLNLWREVAKRGLNLVGQMDSNLSTANLVDYFEQQGIYEPNTLEKLAEHPTKILTALKGTDTQNLQSNVQAMTTLADQQQSIKRFLTAGFDIYPQMYNPNPQTLEGYMTKMDEFIEDFSLRVHIGPLKLYGPNAKRLELIANRLGKDPKEFTKLTKETWDKNYKQGCEAMDSYLTKKYGVGYKEVTRSDVKLNLK